MHDWQYVQRRQSPGGHQALTDIRLEVCNCGGPGRVIVLPARPIVHGQSWLPDCSKGFEYLAARGHLPCGGDGHQRRIQSAAQRRDDTATGSKPAGDGRIEQSPRFIDVVSNLRVDLARCDVWAPPAFDSHHFIVMYEELAAGENLDSFEHVPARAELADGRQPERFDIQSGMNRGAGQQGGELRCKQDAARGPAIEQPEVAEVIGCRHCPPGPALPGYECEVAVDVPGRLLAPL